MKEPGGEVDFERMERESNAFSKRLAALIAVGLLSIAAAFHFASSVESQSAFCDKRLGNNMRDCADDGKLTAKGVDEVRSARLMAGADK